MTLILATRLIALTVLVALRSTGVHAAAINVSSFGDLSEAVEGGTPASVIMITTGEIVFPRHLDVSERSRVSIESAPRHLTSVRDRP